MQEERRRSSIGIFDSGFGGLTVMNAIRHVLPHENIIYFGDTARLPYGNKSAETIVRYSIENATFLMEQGIKILVIACNTACSYAIEQLESLFDIPVIGIIAPAVEQVTKLTKGHVAILGTRATIASGVYQKHFSHNIPGAHLTAISCPLFVPLVEEGYIEHPMTEIVAQEYLRPLKLKHKEVDTVLLACTHYPFLKDIIQKELGEGVTLIDPAFSCADYIKTVLQQKGMVNDQNELPHYQFYVSDDPEKFRLLGKTFLNYPIEHVFARPI